ncbi:hypothetical protein VKT23_020212 [Stygiomarasmius scandens]|uniref:Uncharacterized protein n=1 Tax=Marasmiellus scandens TaxID=2682957 RepID=A0ABR1IJU6_9AGAR
MVGAFLAKTAASYVVNLRYSAEYHQDRGAVEELADDRLDKIYFEKVTVTWEGMKELVRLGLENEHAIVR